MQQFRVPLLSYRLLLAVAGAAVALTAGFAGVTFVRLVGLVVLGEPPIAAQDAGSRTHRSPSQWDYGWLGRAGIVVLSAGCLGHRGRLLPLVIRVVSAGLAPVVAAGVTGARCDRPGCCSRCSAGSPCCRRPGCGS